MPQLSLLMVTLLASCSQRASSAGSTCGEDEIAWLADSVSCEGGEQAASSVISNSADRGYLFIVVHLCREASAMCNLSASYKLVCNTLPVYPCLSYFYLPDLALIDREHISIQNYKVCLLARFQSA